MAMNCYEGVSNPEELKAFVEKQGIDEAENILRAELARRKENLARSKEKFVELNGYLQSHPKGQEVALRSILAQDLYAEATNSNIWYRQKALQGLAESKIVDLKENLSTTNLGFSRNKELGRDFVRAVFGEDNVSPLASKMAKQLDEVNEWLRTRFNNAGGNVGKLDYGYLPQSHDMRAIQKAGKDEWINFVTPLLKENELDLDYVYNTVATGGLNKVKEASLGQGKAMINQHGEHRVLHFKDADSWMEYQERFGNIDPMAAIDNHIKKMTTDISAVEIMGPNPTRMYETLKVQVDKAGVGAEKSEWRAYTDAIWETSIGNVDREVESIGKAGAASQMMRGVNTSTMLGKATLSALSDLGSLITNTVYQGLNPFSVMKKFVKGFNVKNQEDAIRAGLGADVFNSEVTRRFSELGAGFWAKASEALMRGTFMNIWTESARKAFQSEYMHKLLKGRAIKDLPEDELIRLLERVQEQTDYAVINPTARSRAITTGGREKGTAAGEFFRTTTQFQSFTITFMQQHGARIFMQGDLGSKIGYSAAILTTSTLLGGAAMMAKDAAKGFTPREGGNVFSDKYDVDMKAKFWTAAALQGGGAGIFGDLFFSDQTRFGNSAVPTMLGPTGGTIEDAVKLTVGNVQELVRGKDTHFGSEAVQFVNRHANPVNTFYTSLLIDQYVSRNLKLLLDKDYKRKERRKLRKRKKDYGQEKFDFLK